MTRIQAFQHGCTIPEYFSLDSGLSMVVPFACLLTQPNFLVWGTSDILSTMFQYTLYSVNATFAQLEFSLLMHMES